MSSSLRDIILIEVGSHFWFLSLLTDFVHQLRAAFQHPDSEVEVSTRLFHLRQGDCAISRYAAEFRTLAIQTTLCFVLLIVRYSLLG